MKAIRQLISMNLGTAFNAEYEMTMALFHVLVLSSSRTRIPGIVHRY